MNIAIIEDDIRIREELSKLLESNNYNPLIIDNFEDVLSLLRCYKIDLVLLDINLPYDNGFEICKMIKKEINVPIIFVTSRNSDEDELLGIKSGGIDFISKPYNKNVLLEKIKRALKISDPKNFREITIRDYTLDLHLSILKYKDKQVELTRNEFRILYYFFIEDNRIITKDELLEYLWNDKCYLDENILTVNINRLRKKAKGIGIDNLLKTVRGKGYEL